MIDRVCSLIKMKKPANNRGLLLASGTELPGAVEGYQVGCLFQKTDGAAGTCLYVNEGSVDSASFQALAALTAAQEAILGATPGTVAASKATVVDAYKTLRWGGFNPSAALTDAVPFASVPDTWSDGQLDVLAVFGGTGADLTGLVSAKCGRYRHVVNMAGTQNGEVYGLVGQVVAKTVVLGLYSAGLMGTIESNGGFHAGKGTTTSYPVHAGVIGRPGGASIVVDTGATLAALAALSNTSGITATAGDYVGMLVSRCQSVNDAFTVGVKIDPLAVKRGIVIGAEEFTTAGTGIVVNGVALHSGCEFYFDDGGVKLAAGYTEAFRAGYLISTAIDGDTDVSCYTSHDYIYLAESVATRGGVGATWASLLVKAGKTITTTAGLCDFSAFNASVDVPSTAVIGAGTFACGLSIGGNLGGTHTGVAVGIRVRAPSAGAWDGLFAVETGLYVETADAAADVGGSIPIYVNGVVKYLQYWPNPTT